jgi:hypothetical protein
VALREAAVALLLCLSACTDSGDEHPHDVVFRVGAPTGLSKLLPGPGLDGSSAQAADLIYEYGPDYIEDVRAEGTRVIATRNRNCRFSAAELAPAMRYNGMVSARSLDADHIEIVLPDPASAAQMVEFGVVPFDLGPFAIESEEPGHARLRRRGKSAIDVIEIVEVASSDEWRMLMSRQLDVMPSSPNLYREQFTGMGSVRLLDIPPVVSAALFFNVRDPALADAAVRRRIAGGLNRQAIARVASGDGSSAAPDPAVSAADAGVPLPARLSLLVIADESSTLLAASVVRHQLARLNIAIDVEPAPLEQVLDRIKQGRAQVALAQLPNGARAFSRFVSPTPDGLSMTGFASPPYDAAYAAGNLDEAGAILSREMPATVLYEWRMFAAIDSRFCGNVTPSYGSWRWMADLYPCKDVGEEEGEGKTDP